MSADETTEPPGDTPARGSGRSALARNTAIFAVATGFSRIAGLVREVVASGYYGTSGPASAFTFAFQVPNLVRGLVADAALSAAFVPVFTELLEQKKRKEAFELASTLFFLILLVLGAITALCIATAGLFIPLFVDFGPGLTDLTVGLSQVLFPIVVLLGLNGLVVGILNAYNHFSIPAIAPLVWNLVIIGALIALHPLFDEDEQIYAYAIGVLIGTIVQFAMVVPVLGRIDFRLTVAFKPRDPRVRQVGRLMLPVILALGVINIDLVITTALASRISEEAPRAIDAAFRIYMLPQGVFSVALATVLFPTLSRFAARRDVDGLRSTLGVGVRQIALALLPAAAFILVLSTPIVRLLFEHGEFDADSTDQTSLALFWFAFSLPFSGVNLLLTRTFFSLQRPWLPTALAAGSLVVKVLVSLALYEPFGIAGLVIGTAVSGAAMTIGQLYVLRGLLGGRLEGREHVAAGLRIMLASAVMAGAAYVVWLAADEVLGRSILAQTAAVGLASAVAISAYAGAVLAMRIPEALQIERFVRARRGGVV